MLPEFTIKAYENGETKEYLVDNFGDITRVPEPAAFGVKYPDVTVNLLQLPANAGAVMDHVTTRMRQEGLSYATIDEFRSEAYRAKGFDHLLNVVTCWVNTDWDEL